jgi:hypothetical protein
MFTATTKILAVQRIAERQNSALFNARSAKEIVHKTGCLLDSIALGASREQVAELVRWFRADSEWPGDLKGWAWFDERLLVLHDYLAQDETFPTQAELVEELERACKAGVIR